MLGRSSAVRLARALAGEVKRAMATIRSSGHPRPHYISHLLRDDEIWTIQARYGSLFTNSHARRRDCNTDVRVGSYRYDQVEQGGLQYNSKDDESYNHVDLPYGDHLDGLRHGIWHLTESRYREAVEALLRKKSHELTYLNSNRHLPSFEKRPPVVDLDWRPLPEVDHEYWLRYVERASQVPKRYLQIKNSHVEFHARNSTRVFVNSEGSLQIQCQPYWSLECYLWLLSERGDALQWTIHHFVSDPDELPKEKEFHLEIRQTISLLKKLSSAPSLRSYAGPVLLEPVPAGLLIHEALGHRLEGNRLLSSGEGQTFRDALGTPILPHFLTLRDNPTLETFDGCSLVGHYRYDDEGVESKDTILVKSGILKEFLTSRIGTTRRHHSNGHGRSRYYELPIGRMGVTIVEAEEGRTDDELKALLIDEIRRQDLPFGVRIISAYSGETTTESYDFQALLGEINLAARIYPDGREEWIRGVNFVGTPLNAVRSIIAAGRRYTVDNSHCGAESGSLPVSTISPALLLSHLELQSKSEAPYTQYTYPIPWAKKQS